MTQVILSPSQVKVMQNVNDVLGFISNRKQGSRAGEIIWQMEDGTLLRNTVYHLLSKALVKRHEIAESKYHKRYGITLTELGAKPLAEYKSKDTKASKIRR
jgi:hypothetical protein